MNEGFATYLKQFNEQMIIAFQEHDNKYGKDSLLYPDFDWLSAELTGFDSGKFDATKEIHYHYAKWIYNSLAHHNTPEIKTLINLVNCIFIRFIELAMNGNLDGDA